MEIFQVIGKYVLMKLKKISFQEIDLETEFETQVITKKPITSKEVWKFYFGSFELKEMLNCLEHIF